MTYNVSGVDILASDLSPTFCVLPWVHVSTYTNGDLRICCRGDRIKDDQGRNANLNKTDIAKQWNNDFMRQLRLTIADGQYHAACWRCKREEAATGSSRRDHENAAWGNADDRLALQQSMAKDGSVSWSPTYLDLRLGNQCNLKCIMCNTNNSTQWQLDYRKIKRLHGPDNIVLKHNGDFDTMDRDPHSWHELSSFMSWFEANMRDLKVLYFAGGEPLLLTSHSEMLDYLIKSGYSKQVRLRYDSNATHLLPATLQQWQHFQSVHVNVSIDDVGSRNDYIRYGSRFEQLAANMHTLDSSECNLFLTSQCTVGVLNCWDIPQLDEWFQEQEFKRFSPYSINEIFEPLCLTAQVLPGAAKKILSERLTAHADKMQDQNRAGKLRWYIGKISSEDRSALIPDLKAYLDTLDEVRGTNWTEIFPNVADMIEL